MLLLFRKNKVPLLPQEYKGGHYGLESSSNSLRNYFSICSIIHLYNCNTFHKRRPRYSTNRNKSITYVISASIILDSRNALIYNITEVFPSILFSIQFNFSTWDTQSCRRITFFRETLSLIANGISIMHSISPILLSFSNALYPIE